MNNKLFYTITTFIFGAVAILHILRLFYGWEVIMGGFVIPMWASYFGIAVAGFLAYSAISIRNRK